MKIFVSILAVFLSKSVFSQVKCICSKDQTSVKIISLTDTTFVNYNLFSSNNFIFEIDSFILANESIYISKNDSLYKIFNYQAFQKKDTFCYTPQIQNKYIENNFIQLIFLVPDSIFVSNKILIYRYSAYHRFKGSDDSKLNTVTNIGEKYAIYDFIPGIGFSSIYYNSIDSNAIPPSLKIISKCNKNFIKKVRKYLLIKK